jgi:molybdenum cofactor biosynthesis protein B
VLTISDTRDESNDKSGALLAERLVTAGHRLVEKAIVPDDVDRSAPRCGMGAEPGGRHHPHTGGTGFAPRDMTPEAVKPLFRREMDGFSVVFTRRARDGRRVDACNPAPLPARSRTRSSSACPVRPAPAATAGISCSSLELDSRYKPCSLAGQIPRLRHLCA